MKIALCYFVRMGVALDLFDTEKMTSLVAALKDD